MHRLSLLLLLAPALVVGCASRPGKGTLAELHDVRPDLQEAKVEQGLDEAMLAYRRFLEETPKTAMTPEAMRRLAELDTASDAAEGPMLRAMAERFAAALEHGALGDAKAERRTVGGR